MKAAWNDRWVGRLDWECSQLEAAGMAYDVRLGPPVEMDVVHVIRDAEYRLTATFPTLYPYFRPLVATTPGTFQFHPEPFGGDLCLIARDPALWLPRDSLAELIRTQLPNIVRANSASAESDGDIVELEENVPEPVRENYFHPHPHVVFVDSSWRIPPDVEGGILEILLRSDALPLRGAVAVVRDASGSVLARADDRLLGSFPGPRLKARWLRIAEPITWARGNELSPEADAVEYRTSLDALRPNRTRPRSKVGNDAVSITGIVYTDEIRYTLGGDNYGDDWAVLLEVESDRRGGGARKTTPLLIRTMYAGEDDLVQRVPQLVPMRGKRIAVVGLGAIGAPLTIALARSSVGRLAVIDADVVEAGTVARWPFGLHVAGQSKTETLISFVRANYPYTSIEGAAWRFGGPPHSGTDDDEVLDRIMLAETDLIVDASANVALNHALADIAWERHLPFVVLSATEGAWGGMVARLERGRTACWTCFNERLGDSITLPPADTSPSGRVVPVSCSDMTFTGAGFDLTPISDEAVRMIVSRLSEGAANGYPAISWDVGVLALRTDDGLPCPPTWTAHTLEATHGCPTCNG